MPCPCQSRAKTDQQTSAQTVTQTELSPETLNHPQQVPPPAPVTASAAR